MYLGHKQSMWIDIDKGDVAKIKEILDRETDDEYLFGQCLPMPLIQAKAQYLTDEERQTGGLLDIVELCRRKREIIICRTGSA